MTEQWKDDATRSPPGRWPRSTTKLCLLVMIGVRADGTKELVALSDGFRESSESWADLLRDCKRAA
jgi:transposase-like protein